MLMEFSLNYKDLLENQLIIEEEQRHHYTNEYKELTKDYYLAF
jgi:tRNA1Val (adenine37-N6)-methyltransferase